jgi:hypothetical protein
VPGEFKAVQWTNLLGKLEAAGMLAEYRATWANFAAWEKQTILQ